MDRVTVDRSLRSRMHYENRLDTPNRPNGARAQKTRARVTEATHTHDLLPSMSSYARTVQTSALTSEHHEEDYLVAYRILPARGMSNEMDGCMRNGLGDCLILEPCVNGRSTQYTPRQDCEKSSNAN